MYENGFLSNNGAYNDSDIFPEELINLELAEYIPMDITGIMLLYGYGVCRHTTDFLAHIYQNLGYDSSQLFTYHPNLSIRVDNYGKKYFMNSEFQKYIDEAIGDLDLFSREDSHFAKIFGNGDIVVRVDSQPERRSFINHTMNIVLDKKEKVHILDTRYHCVGQKQDNNKIRLDYQGLTHTDFVQSAPPFDTYYGTDYSKGVELLKYETDIGADSLTSILYSELCKKNISYFEEFQLKNQKNYNKIANNINRLVKK